MNIKNNPIHILNIEHEHISKLNNIIFTLKDEWKTDEQHYQKQVEYIFYFLQKYSDGYHHFKEEEILFPAMSQHPEFLLQGILDELKEHHENFREYIAEAIDALEEKNFEKVQSILEKLITELMDHIAIENDELFVMAENLFTEKELEEIFFRFSDIDRELGKENKLEIEKIPALIKTS
ncbi:MAG: hemerythrin domain-containing protein [Sphingobacteriaceae bacterium]|nr:hemerythrin domain-containing protein [Sphingobacteriaceae bacterium]